MKTSFELIDNDEMASANRVNLQVPNVLGLVSETVRLLADGVYTNPAGLAVELKPSLEAMLTAKRSIPPTASLPVPPEATARQTLVTITNTQTTTALRDLTQQGYKTLALNFANGTSPGGGFLHGALARKKPSAAKADCT